MREPVSARRFSRAAAGSVAVHVAAIVLFWLTPEITPNRVPRVTPEDLRKSAILILPRDLIQHDRGADSSAGDGGRQQQTSAARAPQPAAPPPPRFQPPAPTPGQPGDSKAPMIQAPIIEAPTESVAPPSLIAGAGVPGSSTGTGVAPLAPKSKSPFEAVGGGAPPSPSSRPLTPAEQAIRSALRNGGTVSSPIDTPQDTSGLAEILSDTHGVDFTQYMAQARNKVKSNWNASEAVRKGLTGVVRIDFKIDRQGDVRNLKIVSPSGSSVLDLAAVRAITASGPFAFLPPAYKDKDVEFVWTFTYIFTHR